MNRDTVLADLRARGHAGYSLFEDPRGKPNVIVLTFGRNGFQTWIQDERAQPIAGSLRAYLSRHHSRGSMPRAKADGSTARRNRAASTG